jgi:hypothetical protein
MAHRLGGREWGAKAAWGMVFPQSWRSGLIAQESTRASEPRSGHTSAAAPKSDCRLELVEPLASR